MGGSCEEKQLWKGVTFFFVFFAMSAMAVKCGKLSKLAGGRTASRNSFLRFSFSYGFVFDFLSFALLQNVLDRNHQLNRPRPTPRFWMLRPRGFFLGRTDLLFVQRHSCNDLELRQL